MKILEERYPVRIWTEDMTPFEVLVSVVLSQATERRNNRAAFENLRKRFKIVPEVLAKAEEEDIIHCITPAGLQNVKGPRIKAISEILVEHYNGDLGNILKLPADRARVELMSLPGVGEKTADVILSLVAHRGTFPVDTHIKRIARRLGLVDTPDYGKIKERFEGIIPEDKRGKAHLALIKFGRNICRARNPSCDICPIEEFCEYKGSWIA
ncbi:MAG: endonuclease III domain-containing protein [Candidatus Hydrothermarchaeales archaeon]